MTRRCWRHCRSFAVSSPLSGTLWVLRCRLIGRSSSGWSRSSSELRPRSRAEANSLPRLSRATGPAQPNWPAVAMRPSCVVKALVAVIVGLAGGLAIGSSVSISGVGASTTKAFVLVHAYDAPASSRVAPPADVKPVAVRDAALTATIETAEGAIRPPFDRRFVPQKQDPARRVQLTVLG